MRTMSGAERYIIEAEDHDYLRYKMRPVSASHGDIGDLIKATLQSHVISML